MNRYIYLSLIAVIFSLLATSCEKPEQAVVLPPKTGSAYATVEMGEEYTEQVFFDFESGNVVYTSKVNSWDLAFETGPLGYHVFLNGGMQNMVYNTHQTDIRAVKTPPNIKSTDYGPDKWFFDATSGSVDSTGFGDWRSASSSAMSKNEVYIITSDAAHFPDSFKKVQVVGATDKEYIMLYGDLRSENVREIKIPKDDNYNFSYFSFKSEGVVYPDPPKKTWDIVFTRYRYVYYDQPGMPYFPYVVSGALINPYNTTAAVDSSVAYENLKIDKILSLDFKNKRDMIGFSWKQYSIEKGLYTVNPKRLFIIKNRDGEYWKLHFLDFYNKQGVKGSPSFEYERIQ